ncbi:hypothetical protein B0H66DRAFT_252390 [Apodospora peruviana]|uniref:Ankyrin repeat protein n=1 Tax=Apodospora peruviana TaxID=516989 RepID=A0AAE0I5L3_9PEZI|nr:hypothetical protein B0H66DRAFT_252390 [Apodospora peruviana]
MPPNPYLLAADDPDALVQLLRDNPSIAQNQDEYGYSLVHAAASYNHLALLESLVRDYNVPVDIKDSDGETALYVVETVAAARLLVEDLHADPQVRNNDGQTARQRIEEEEDFPEVVAYLAGLESNLTNGVAAPASSAAGATTNGTTEADLPSVPEGLQVTVGTMNEEDEAALQPDPEFRRRIEELAAREDFQTPEGQAELRRLVTEAITGEGLTEERNVRPRQD